MTDYEFIITHYMSYVGEPGWRGHVLHRLDELDRQDLFKGIKADLFQRVRDAKGRK